MGENRIAKQWPSFQSFVQRMQNGLVRMWTLSSKVSLPGGEEERRIVEKDGIVRNRGDTRGYEKSRSANLIALGSGMKQKGKARARRESQEEEDGLFGSWLPVQIERRM